jgi:hypothetical protein
MLNIDATFSSMLKLHNLQRIHTERFGLEHQTA